MTDPDKIQAGAPGDSPDLEDFFAAGRAETPEPAPDFMARLTADALAEMPVAPPRAATTPGLFGQVRAALGGWPGIAGLAAACAAGIWIGVDPPAGVEMLWGTSVALDSLEPIGSFGQALMEG